MSKARFDSDGVSTNIYLCLTRCLKYKITAYKDIVKDEHISH